MKVQIVKKEESFTPVTIQMTFETNEELQSFLSVCNASSYDVWNALENGRAVLDESSEKSWEKVKSKIYWTLNKL